MRDASADVEMWELQVFVRLRGAAMEVARGLGVLVRYKTKHCSLALIPPPPPASVLSISG